MRNFLIITLSLLSFGTSQDKVSTENFTQYGDSYTGDLKDGKRDGEGIFIYPNGDRYEGEWKNDKRDGMGIFTFEDQTLKYIGEFKNDNFHGQGTLYVNNEEKYEGTWNYGELRQEATISYPLLDRYEGEWKNDREEG